MLDQLVAEEKARLRTEYNDSSLMSRMPSDEDQVRCLALHLATTQQFLDYARKPTVLSCEIFPTKLWLASVYVRGRFRPYWSLEFEVSFSPHTNYSSLWTDMFRTGIRRGILEEKPEWSTWRLRL